MAPPRSRRSRGRGPRPASGKRCAGARHWPRASAHRRAPPARRGSPPGPLAWQRLYHNGHMSCRLARTVRAVFVTTNESKRREAQRILGVELESAAPDLPEVQSLDFAEVAADKSEEHTSELQSRQYLVCRLLLEKKI